MHSHRPNMKGGWLTAYTLLIYINFAYIKLYISQVTFVYRNVLNNINQLLHVGLSTQCQ